MKMIDTLYINTTENPIPIGIFEGEVLDCDILWSFTEISVSNDLSADDFQNSLQKNFCGSNHFFGDEGYVFDNDSLKIKSLFLNVPEENFNGEYFLKKWLNVSMVKGIPFLKESKKFVSTSSSNYRYLSPLCDYLICLFDTDTVVDNCYRISVHDRLDLLFKNSLHCGFLLKDPIRSLVRFDGEAVNANAEIDISSIKTLFYDFFRVINGDAYDSLDNRDEDIKSMLIHTVDELMRQDLSKEPIYALNRQCLILLEDYYDVKNEV